MTKTIDCRLISRWIAGYRHGLNNAIKVVHQEIAKSNKNEIKVLEKIRVTLIGLKDEK